MRNPRSIVLQVCLALMLVPGLVVAQSQAGPQKGKLYVGAGGILHQAPLDSKTDDVDLGPAVIVGYGLTERLAAEVLYSRLDQDFRFGGQDFDGDTDLTWFNLLYQFQDRNGWRPFVLAGVGRTDIGFDNAPDFDDTQVNFGVGMFRALNDRFSLRADVRATTTDEGNDDWGPFALVGITGVLGNIAKPPPLDTDSDGVPDDSDKCPNTPFGRTVDTSGCQLDGDADGVVDAEDECPNTPPGAAVDSRGCALDSDGDGVPDYRDDCPDTEPGAKVDERGCYIELEETVTIDLNLEFDTDSSALRPEHYSEIGRVVQFLREYPTANAVIEGHTDSDGSEAYNQALSERRAESVRRYLVAEAGIAAQRLSAVGYGETRPVASNETAAGKQENRRVSAVVSGTQTVRQ